MTRLALIVAQCVCVISLVQAQPPQKLPNAELVDKLKRATQEMLDAVAVGDKAVWDRYLADGSIYADEEGNVNEVRSNEGASSAARGLSRFDQVGETKSLVQENVVVLSHVDHEE